MARHMAWGRAGRGGRFPPSIGEVKGGGIDSGCVMEAVVMDFELSKSKHIVICFDFVYPFF